MVTKKEGPLARLAKRLGLGKTSVGGGAYESCWGCTNNRCGVGFDRTCACCRAGHSGVR